MEYTIPAMRENCPTRKFACIPRHVVIEKNAYSILRRLKELFNMILAGKQVFLFLY